jgi:tRNA pseudouridine13 synthase
MKFDRILQPPLVTADLPGLGGRIKSVPEDFDVEEIPAYEPCGTGDFLYLWLEKRDMGAEYFTRQIAKRLGIAPDEIGTAGLKDRRAVTRQMVSVPSHVEERLSQLEGDGIRILRTGRHGNKLKSGHLHGNRFRIIVRDLDPAVSKEDVLPKLLERIRTLGMPNYYGPQRFGRDAETLQLGLAMMRPRDPSPPGGRREGVRGTRGFLRKLALSAVQSAMFNHYLARRWSDGFLHRVLAGDVMAKVPFGGMFLANDALREQQRFDAREIVSAGPIVGRKTFPAAGIAAEREAGILTDFGLEPASLQGFGKLMQGTRRHNVVYVDDLTAQVKDVTLELAFSLPAGSYATVMLREFMKNDLAEAEE